MRSCKPRWVWSAIAANLANLLIARADSRMRDLTGRRSASRGRLFRQLITEGLRWPPRRSSRHGSRLGGLRLLLATATIRLSEIGLD
jgi:hypothetical protein